MGSERDPEAADLRAGAVRSRAAARQRAERNQRAAQRHRRVRHRLADVVHREPDAGVRVQPVAAPETQRTQEARIATPLPTQTRIY